MKIMVITKNILSETAFQNRLQHLDHQVFCTTCLIGEIKESHLFYRKFDAIILSETIPRKEQYLYLKELARVKTPLFLRSEDIPTSEELSISYQYGILNWLRLDATLDTLRENLLLAELNKPIQREDEKLDVEGIKLTAAERALLAVLYSTPKEHLPMERLCKLIYDTEETANNRKKMTKQLTKLNKKFK
ncbi:transcriptional regulator [Enterococcus faecalis]|nr:transcriptional regulator [Enterococcus faecalis]